MATVTSSTRKLNPTSNTYETNLGLTVGTNIVVGGTVDGRDIASDGSKLDGIESSATADQTAAEIRALVESASNSNVFTDADHTKLNGIATSANNYSLPLSSSSTRGGVKVGFTESGKNYPVELSSEKMFVNVPWTDTNTNTTYTAGSGLTLSGTTFSHSDTSTQASSSNSGRTYIQSINVDGQGHVTGLSTATETVVNTDTNTQLSNEQVQDIVGAMVTSNSESGITVTYQDTDGTIDFSVASQTDQNFTNADHTKLDGIATGADVTPSWVPASNPSYATQSYVGTQISNLVGGAPAALDTLNELAAAINDDASYASSITTALAAKAPLASPTFTGTVTTPNLTIGSGNKIKFANNDFIRYDDANGVGRFHFDSDGGTNNASVQAATFVGALSGNASTATTLATARTIALSGAVTGSASFNGSAGVTIATTATADPTLTINGDASGAATFTNLGNATLTLTIADDSHNHVISNVDGLQTALDSKQAAGTYNTIIGTGTDIDTSTFNIVDNIYVTDGVITSMGTRELSNLRITDTRDGEITPNDYTGQALSLDFTDEFGSLGAWWSGITMKGWSDNYTAWQLIGPSNTSANDNLYFRTGVGTTWGTMQRIFHDGYHPNADQLTTARNIALGGDVTGSASFNGGSNITISASLASGSVGASEIAANAVGSSEIANDAVGASEIAASAVGASELNVSGNGTTAQFLRSDGDGTFTWATPTDTNTNTTYTAGSGLTLSGTTFSHSDTSSQASSSNSGRTYIQSINVDGQGHVTGLSTATETVVNTDTNTQLSNEQVQDIVGAMVTSNSESGITVTYQDTDGTIDFSVASQTDQNFTTTLKNKLDGIASGATNVTNNNQLTNGAGYITSDTQLSTEQVQDAVGAMLSGNTESGITVTYDDTNNEIDFTVASQTDQNFTTTLKNKLDGIASGATNVTNNNQLTNGAGYITSDTQLSTEQVQDAVGAMLSGNTESGITVTYDDTNNEIDFTVASQTDNNFTNADHSKLDGIAAGAEVNVQSNWNATSGDAFIQNKPTIPSGNQIIDWTVSAGSGTEIHSDNYTNTTYSAGSGLTLSGTTFSHSDTSSQSSSANSGRTYIQSINLDGQGHVTGLSTATETVTNTDTNTTYSAGRGLDLSGTQFQLETDLRDSISYIGYDSNDYLQWSNNSYVRAVVSGTERFRVNTSGIDVTGVATANAFRTDTSNTDYNLITRNSTSGTLYVQAAQSNSLQTIASFRYGSATVNQGTETFRIRRDNVNVFGANFTVGGSITGNSKNFSIPHPTKEGKRLVHSCLEGPEIGVYFRGRSQSSTIEMPDYWAGLVHLDSMTVELTAIGPNQDLYVASIADDGDVTVASNTETPLNYFYVVYGERKDLERLEVEIDDTVEVEESFDN